MDLPLSEENLKKKLGSLFKGKFNRGIPKPFASSLETLLSYAKGSEHAAPVLRKFSEKMREERKVRIVSASVPEGVLPDGITAVLHDIRVNGYGPDDEIYSQDDGIRKMIPRGATLMDMTGHLSVHDVVIYANKKFTGGIGDEDDSQPENNDLWKKYCLEDPESAHRIICMEKINGEAAHFSGRYIEGQFYIIAGSKNVHMLIKERNDIDLYDGERYAVAKLVARSVWDTLESLDDDHRRLVFSFLHHTKSTAICEILQPDSQHIINLSHLEKPLLKVISFTPIFSEDEGSSLLALPPHHTLDLLQALGFNTPSYSKILAKDVVQHQNKVRGEFDKEGEVLYFLNQNEETIGMVKSKTIWYIMRRALREKAVHCFLTSKKHHDWNLQSRIESTNKRYEEIQSWLKFSDSYLQSWKELGENFLEWMNNEINEDRVNESDIRPKFPVIWERFLKETGLTDQIIP